VSFHYVFAECLKAQFNKYIFYAEGEQGTRFLDQSISFEHAFYRSSFSGVQGTAPDLWNCDFGEETGVAPIKSTCFGGDGNNLDSLDNYASIPEDWII
jgi:hypothetical protein